MSSGFNVPQAPRRQKPGTLIHPLWLLVFPLPRITNWHLGNEEMPGATPNDALWTLLWLLGYTPVLSVGRCLSHRLAHYLLKMKEWLHSRWVSPGVWTIEQHRFSNGLCTTVSEHGFVLLNTKPLISTPAFLISRQTISFSSRGQSKLEHFWQELGKPQVQDETSSPPSTLLLLAYCFVLGLPVLEIHPICFFLWAFGLSQFLQSAHEGQTLSCFFFTL